MIPLSDDNPTLRTPAVTIGLLVAIAAAWVVAQGAGLDPRTLMASVCNLGMVPGEITGAAKPGTALPIGGGMACVVDAEPVNWLTPITSMFLHGSWAHLLGNGLFLWVFGNNIEDSMGRLRFLAFYLVCGLAGAAAQVAVDPASPVPVVGASAAISGVMGAYLVLYPRVRVNMLFIFVIIFKVIPLPAWAVLIYWLVLQVLGVLPQFSGPASEPAGGVAFMGHVGGFVAGVLLVKLFEDRRLVDVRTRTRHRLHPDHL
jgi:membrane associated rhomboid family serine protease